MPDTRRRAPPNPEIPRPRPARRWLSVVAVSVFINTSYGTLSYAFSVLVTKSGAGGVEIVSTGSKLAGWRSASWT